MSDDESAGASRRAAATAWVEYQGQCRGEAMIEAYWSDDLRRLDLVIDGRVVSTIDAADRPIGSEIGASDR